MSILIVKYEYTHTHKRVYSYAWMSILIPNLPRTTARPATTNSANYYGMIQGKRLLYAAQNPPRWVQDIPRMGLKTPLIAAQNSPDCGSLIPFLWLKIPLIVAQKSPVRIARTAATSLQTSRPRSKPPPPRLGEHPTIRWGNSNQPLGEPPHPTIKPIYRIVSLRHRLNQLLFYGLMIKSPISWQRR